MNRAVFAVALTIAGVIAHGLWTEQPEEIAQFAPPEYEKPTASLPPLLNNTTLWTVTTAGSGTVTAIQPSSGAGVLTANTSTTPFYIGTRQ